MPQYPRLGGLFVAAVLQLVGAAFADPTPTHYYSVRPNRAPGDGPSGPDDVHDHGHHGMSTLGVTFLFACVGLTYYLVMRMSQRAVAGDAYLVPHVEAVERLIAGVASDGVAPTGGLGPRRYSTISFDDDADNHNTMHPAGGHEERTFKASERAAALADPSARI